LGTKLKQNRTFSECPPFKTSGYASSDRSSTLVILPILISRSISSFVEDQETSRSAGKALSLDHWRSGECERLTSAMLKERGDRRLAGHRFSFHDCERRVDMVVLGR
jgi:hypothetical protein